MVKMIIVLAWKEKRRNEKEIEEKRLFDPIA